MRHISRSVRCLLLIAATCVLWLVPLLAPAARCPRQLEVIVPAKPEASRDAADFIARFGSAFAGDGISLATGLAEPDYVLGVTYEASVIDGTPIVSIDVTLGFTGGTVGVASHRSDGADPIAYYGDFIGIGGVSGRGLSLDTLGPAMEGMAAEVSAWILKFEKISASATAKLPPGCYRPGEARPIEVHAPPTSHGSLGVPTVFMHRYIVRAEAGEIRNGIALADDEKARVFLLDSDRSAEGSRFTLDYVAPVGRESDQLTVWSSCDISHLPIRHPSEASKHEIILEKGISVCGGYRLEYAHEFDIVHEEAGLVYTLSGEIPLRLVSPDYTDDAVSGGKLEGEATLDVVMMGSFRECIVTYMNQMDVIVTGEIRRELGATSARTVVQVKLTENYGGVGSGVIDCPKQEPFVTGGVPAPQVVQGQEAKLIFDHIEGDKITRPFDADGVTGNATWIIHVPER